MFSWRPGTASRSIPGRYQSHRPEQTFLSDHDEIPAFAALMAEQGKEIAGLVQREI